MPPRTPWPVVVVPWHCSVLPVREPKTRRHRARAQCQKLVRGVKLIVTTDGRQVSADNKFWAGTLIIIFRSLPQPLYGLVHRVASLVIVAKDPGFPTLDRQPPLQMTELSVLRLLHGEVQVGNMNEGTSWHIAELEAGL